MVQILTKGHKYALPHFEIKTNNEVIQFIEKKSIVTTEETLSIINDGTTNEAVIEMLIDRMQYLQSKFPCKENFIVITNLEESLMWLNKRTEDRELRGVEEKNIK